MVDVQSLDLTRIAADRIATPLTTANFFPLVIELASEVLAKNRVNPKRDELMHRRTVLAQRIVIKRIVLDEVERRRDDTVGAVVSCAKIWTRFAKTKIT